MLVVCTSSKQTAHLYHEKIFNSNMNFQNWGSSLFHIHLLQMQQWVRECVREKEYKICYLPTHPVHNPKARQPTIAPLRYGRSNIPDTNLDVAKLQHSVKIYVLGIPPWNSANPHSPGTNGHSDRRWSYTTMTKYITWSADRWKSSYPLSHTGLHHLPLHTCIMY